MNLVGQSNLIEIQAFNELVIDETSISDLDITPGLTAFMIINPNKAAIRIDISQITIIG